MKIDGWKYYNHAAIPTCAPHEAPDMSPVSDGTVWNIDGGKPLFVRYTTEFDCDDETDWWYVIRSAPFDIEALSNSSKKHIRQAFRKCTVRRIDARDHLEELYICYAEAHEKYRNAGPMTDRDSFFEGRVRDEEDGVECWGCFRQEDDRLIGYMTVCVYDIYAEIRTAKFSPEFLNLGASNALYATVYPHYLNELGKEYVSSGTRNINHITNTQDYKERRFACRKAYCKLHVKYHPRIGWVIKLLYPFRGILKRLDKIGLVHQINGVMQMEEIVRKQETRYE